MKRIALLSIALLVIFAQGGLGSIGVSGASTNATLTEAVVFEDTDTAIIGGTPHTLVEVRFDTAIDQSTIATSEIGVVTTQGSFIPATAVQSGASTDDKQILLDLGTSLSPISISSVNITPDASFDTTSGSTVTGSTLSNRTVTVTTTTMTEGAGNPDRVVYHGEKVAFVGDDAGESIYIEGATGSPFVFDGAVTNDGQVYVLNTSSYRQAVPYAIAFDDDTNPDTALSPTVDDDGDGETDEDRLLEMREFTLNLTITQNPDIDDADITENESLTGVVSSNVGNEDVIVLLRGPDADWVKQQVVTIEGDGSGEFSFSNLSISEADDHLTLIATHQPTGTSAVADVKVSKVDFHASFSESTYRDERGDIVNITIEMSETPEDREETDSATVSIGDADIGYSANLTVHDGNNDEEVILQWNTYAADGPGGATEFTVAPTDADEDPDSVTVLDLSSDVSGGPSDVLDAGGYDLTVRGRADAPDRDADDIGMVGLEPRELEEISVFTAPSTAEFEAPADLYGGTVSLSERVAKGDIAIIQISGTGIEGGLMAQSGSNHTARFVQLATSVANFTINQTNPEPNLQPKLLDYSDYGNVSFIPNPANDTYFLVIDTDTVRTVEDVDNDRRVDTGDPAVDLEDGDRFRSTFKIQTRQGGWTNTNTSIQTRWRIVGASATVATEQVGEEEKAVVHLPDEDHISGTTTLAPGSELTVRLSEGENEPAFLRSKTIVVTGNQTWTGEFDFAGFDPGTNFTVDVRHDGDPLVDEPVPGVVVFDNQTTSRTSTETPTTTTQTTRTEETPTTTSGTTTSTTTHTQTTTSTPSPTTTTPTTTTPSPSVTTTTTPMFGGLGVIVTPILVFLVIYVRSRRRR